MGALAFVLAAGAVLGAARVRALRGRARNATEGDHTGNEAPSPTAEDVPRATPAPGGFDEFSGETGSANLDGLPSVVPIYEPLPEDTVSLVNEPGPVQSDAVEGKPVAPVATSSGPATIAPTTWSVNFFDNLGELQAWLRDKVAM